MCLSSRIERYLQSVHVDFRKIFTCVCMVTADGKKYFCGSILTGGIMNGLKNLDNGTKDDWQEISIIKIKELRSEEPLRSQSHSHPQVLRPRMFQRGEMRSLISNILVKLINRVETDQRDRRF